MASTAIQAVMVDVVATGKAGAYKSRLVGWVVSVWKSPMVEDFHLTSPDRAARRYQNLIHSVPSYTVVLYFLHYYSFLLFFALSLFVSFILLLTFDSPKNGSAFMSLNYL